MLRSECKSGMIIRFGRKNGEKTKARITRVNTKTVTVETIEERGQRKIRPAGAVFRVPFSLADPVADSSGKSRKEQVVECGDYTMKLPNVDSDKQIEDYRDKVAKREALSGAAALSDACALKNPPTYIASSLRYLDGTTLTRHGQEYDGQKSKLYRAEDCCDRGTKFETFQEAERYFEKVLNAAWFKRRFNDPDVTLKEGRGRGSAFWHNSRNIRLSTKNHMCERILLHELTHALVPLPHAGHGRLFCAIYLDLVRHFMGDDAYDALLAGYRQQNVKYSPHRSVPTRYQ